MTLTHLLCKITAPDGICKTEDYYAIISPMPTKQEIAAGIGSELTNIYGALQGIIHELITEDGIPPGQHSGYYHYDYPLEDTIIIVERVLRDYHRHPSLAANGVTPESIGMYLSYLHSLRNNSGDYDI